MRMTSATAAEAVPAGAQPAGFAASRPESTEHKAAGVGDLLSSVRVQASQ